jgi:hypothetical protein
VGLVCVVDERVAGEAAAHFCLEPGLWGVDDGAGEAVLDADLLEFAGSALADVFLDEGVRFVVGVDRVVSVFGDADDFQHAPKGQVSRGAGTTCLDLLSHRWL